MEIGVSAWSLQIPEREFERILKTIREELCLSTVQIGAWGFIKLDERERARRVEAIDNWNITVPSTTVAFAGEDYSTPDAARKTVGFYDPSFVDERLQHITDMADMTADLDVHLLTTHLGYIAPTKSDPKYAHMRDVTTRICDMLGERDIELGAETGGLESAETLLDFIGSVDRKNLKVNFDPANVVRAGGRDPMAELDVLKSLVAGVHLKDALTLQPSGIWGNEVALGQGAIGVERFVAKLKAIGFSGPLIIEREGGPDPIGDINRGAEILRRLV